MPIEIDGVRQRWSQVDTAPDTFGAILAKMRGDTPETVLQRNIEEFKEAQGCVIRALEHALGVVATAEECLMRAVQVEGVGNAIVEFVEHVIDGYEGDFLQFYRAEADKDWHSILELIGEISTRESQLGKALAFHTIEGHQNANIDQVQAWLNMGTKVLLCTELMYPSPSHPGKNEIGRHMAHIQIANNGNLILLSDDGAQMSRPQINHMLDIITLSPKV